MLLLSMITTSAQSDAPPELSIVTPVRADGAPTDGVIRTTSSGGAPQVVSGPGAPFALTGGPGTANGGLSVWSPPAGGWQSGSSYTVTYGSSSLTFTAGSAPSSPHSATVVVNRVEPWDELPDWFQREISLDLVITGDDWGWTEITGDPLDADPQFLFTLDGPFDGLRSVVQRYDGGFENPCFTITPWSAAGVPGTSTQICEQVGPDGEVEPPTEEPPTDDPTDTDDVVPQPAGGCSATGASLVSLAPLALLGLRRRP